MAKQTWVAAVPVVGRHTINTYLVLGRRPILVDAGTPGNGRKIYDGIARHGVDPAELALIVLTHAHLDHFGSAAELRRLTGAPIAAHAADAGPYRSGRARRPYRPTGPMGRLMARARPLYARIEAIEPDILLEGPAPLAEFGVDGRVMPTPGHTAGSVSVLTDEGDLVAGDLIAGSFMGLIPRRPAAPPFHDDPARNLASLQEMLALRPRALHVGHGGPLDPARVARWAAREQRRLA